MDVAGPQIVFEFKQRADTRGSRNQSKRLQTRTELLDDVFRYRIIVDRETDTSVIVVLFEMFLEFADRKLSGFTAHSATCVVHIVAVYVHVRFRHTKSASKAIGGSSKECAVS